MNINIEEKRSMISELIELSKEDGHVSEEEINFIKQIGKVIGFKDIEIIELFKHPTPFNPPNNHFDRIVHFQQLVLLMNVDQQIDSKEIDHLKKMGIKLGLNPNAINEVLNRMKDYPNNMIPPNDLIAIYSKYLN